MCEKKKFEKILADIIIAKNMSKNSIKNVKYGRMENRSYYCKKCNAYHLTSQPYKFFGENK